MNKRDFLKTMGVGSIAAASGIASSSPRIDKETKPQGPAEERVMNWMWMGPDTKVAVDEWKRRFAVWRANNIHAILPEIYNGKQAYYKSSFLPSAGDWLEKILPIAKSEGLEVHAWNVSMPCNIAEIYNQHKDWFVVNGKGESSVDKPAYVDYYKFTCPNQPGSREFIRKRIEEISSIDGLDGVHLDYIRFPDVIIAQSLQPKYGIRQDREYPEYDYCYCDVCRSRFNQEYGFDPMTLKDPAVSPEWREFRYNSITGLVNDVLLPIIKNHGKISSAATFPNWEAVRQRWHQWNLDFALPMLYHQFYYGDADWVRDETRAGIDRIREQGKKTQLFSGLFVGDMAPAGLTKLIEKAYEGGSKGIVLFSASGMNEPLWQAFKAATNGV